MYAYYSISDGELLFLVVLLISSGALYKIISWKGKRLLSWTINVSVLTHSVTSKEYWSRKQYLLIRNPIWSRGMVRRQIPTCPYQWPNGQGDVAKFLDGEKNSKGWAEEYGRVYRIWSGMNAEVWVHRTFYTYLCRISLTPYRVLTDPEDIKTVFKDSDLHSKAINNDAGWLMSKLLGNCLGLISGAQWRQVRAATDEAFTYHRVAASLSRITSITREHLMDLNLHGRLAKGMVDPAKDLRMLSFWTVAEMLYGDLTPDLRSQLQSLIPLRESLFNRVILGGVTRFSWSRFLPTSTNRDLDLFQEGWRQFNDTIYGKCQQTKSQTTIVSLYKAWNAGSITKDQALQTLDEMLFANLDVTIGGISWNFLFLAANRDVQSQLRAEITQARTMLEVSEENNHSQSRWENYVLRSDTLLAASILESARLKPLAAFSVPQAAPTARIVGGFSIPAGTNFVIDTHALNIRNQYWGTDSTAYRPSRFLGRKASEMRYHYWRFGMGARKCLGKYAADLIIRVLVAELVENYELGLDATTEWDKNAETWITNPDTQIRCEKLVQGCWRC